MVVMVRLLRRDCGGEAVVLVVAVWLLWCGCDGVVNGVAVE